ncbi:hypothetical protein [Kitasatospora sp. NPDC087314]|uniref:hypothetical protein n=1 Tax=Kitasatospora sp. NPDC087314 TaxID=3364068 RepID=UPI0037F70C98
MFRAINRRATADLPIILGLTTTACSTGQETTSGAPSVAPVSGKISITYLQKQGDQEYFVGEVQAAIAQKTNGVIVVVPDPAVGPQVVQTAKDGKVALLTSDDQVCATGPDPAKCARTDLVPRIGFRRHPQSACGV